MTGIRTYLALGMCMTIAAGCNFSRGTKTNSIQSSSTSGPKAGADVQVDPELAARPKAFSQSEALGYINRVCGDCHAPGKALYATWALPEEDVLLKDARWLEGDALSQTAYQAITNKYVAMEKGVDDLGKPPSPMPPQFKDEADKKDLGRLISWFQDTFPAAVKEAHVRFGEGAPFQSIIKVDLAYKCSSVLNGQQFMTRFSEKALGSASFVADVDLLTPAEKAAPATDAVRKKVVDGFLANEEYARRFEQFAIKPFAQRISNAGKIVSEGRAQVPRRSDAALKDMEEEFYQLVLKYYKEKTYPELFLLDKVMVTQNTAPLYAADGVACTAPASGWGECTLSPQRANFFGTIGFLISKPSSMFSSNNNYGRGGDTFSTIFGEVLMANTDGISGDAPKPIPSCLNLTKDRRWKKDKDDPTKLAPWGAISVPFYGRVCQGCHLNRHLAAAAVVFRPFGKAGEIITPAAIDRADGPYADDLKDDDLRQYVYHTDTEETDFKKLQNLQPVTRDYYKELLTELQSPDATCFPDARDPQNAEKTVKANSLAKYAEVLINQNDGENTKIKGTATLRGLNRILPSVFLNSTRTNLEVITAVNNAFNENQGKLEPMLRAFFATETFGCSSK